MKCLTVGSYIWIKNSQRRCKCYPKEHKTMVSIDKNVKNLPIWKIKHLSWNYACKIFFGLFINYFVIFFWKFGPKYRLRLTKVETLNPVSIPLMPDSQKQPIWHLLKIRIPKVSSFNPENIFSYFLWCYILVKKSRLQAHF